MDILLAGRQRAVIERAQEELALPEVTVHGATSLAEVDTAMDAHDIEHVFVGPGLGVEDRLAMVRHIIERSDTTCVHLKDFSRGPEGALDFVRGIVDGLRATYR